MATTEARASSPVGNVVIPLALCQFVASYAASNMNVAISSIAKDIGTTVIGVQTSITLFTLTMAALMITGSKLTDFWGRKNCFVLGLVVYGAGGLIAALCTSLPLLIVGYSLLGGIGSALMIPPVYIIVTVAFTDLSARAKAFGIVSAAAGIGAAAGPLIGGLLTTTISWRASFGAQVLLVLAIIVMTRKFPSERVRAKQPRFDLLGAVLSAAALFLIVLGLLQSSHYGWFASRKDFVVGGKVIIKQGGVSPVWIFVAAGAIVLAAFYFHLRSWERKGRAPLLATRLFRNRVSNLGLTTQTVQWLVLQGSFFVCSVFLQQARGLNAISTGLVLTPATAGVLGSSMLAGRLAKRLRQKVLITSGFVITFIGMVLLLLLVRTSSSIVTFVPGLLLMGVGVGLMLTSSVNVVQSSFPEKDQGEISGLSRSVSNLGSSLGTAIAGSVLVSGVVEGNRIFGAALAVLVVVAVLGLVAAMALPRNAGAPPEDRGAA